MIKCLLSNPEAEAQVGTVALVIPVLGGGVGGGQSAKPVVSEVQAHGRPCLKQTHLKVPGKRHRSAHTHQDKEINNSRCTAAGGCLALLLSGALGKRNSKVVQFQLKSSRA